MLQSTHLSMSKEQSIQPHILEVFQQVLREFRIGWIFALHCEGAQHGHGHGHGHVDMDLDLHSHQDMDMDMDMGTSRKQWLRFCTWRDAMRERAMS